MCEAQGLPVSEVPEDEDVKGREAEEDEGQFFIRSSRAFREREGELVPTRPPLQSKADVHSVRHRLTPRPGKTGRKIAPNACGKQSPMQTSWKQRGIVPGTVDSQSR